MAEAAEEAKAPPKKESGGMMGSLVNGIVVFVMALGAVVAGGFINAKLHPMPDLKLDKDGKITASNRRPPPPAAMAARAGKAAREPRTTTPSIRRWW